MDPRVRTNVLWGVVGALAFLVLAQGYRLVTGRGVPFLALLGVAVVVGVVSGLTTYAAGTWLARNKRV